MEPQLTLAEQRVLQILKRVFDEEEALILLQYWRGLFPSDVVRREDLERTELNLRLEIEKVRKEVAQTRAELVERIEQVRAELSKEIEQVRGESAVHLERIRAELIERLEQSRVSIIRWSFAFWITQFLALVSLVLALLRS